MVLLILLPTLWFPFGRDQSVFAYVGSTIARGGLPYVDAWDLKPPGIYLAYAALAGLTPDTGPSLMLAVRAADLGMAIATGLLLALLAREWCGREAAWAAAGWYAALYLHGTFWSLAQAESWANPLVLGAVLLCARPERPSVMWGAAGLLLGLAAVLKFTAVVPAVPFAAWGLWRAERRAPAAGSLAVGFALPVALAFGWLAARGAWGTYLEIQRGFVQPYTWLNAAGPVKRIANVFGYTLGWLRDLWLPTALAVVGAVARRLW
ncbi:MAG TPA: hypothetical protein VFU47_08065, partial [Armatimonadota bacterium]|nr:hypothetical protein [Armatimonadota bacterium]